MPCLNGSSPAAPRARGEDCFLAGYEWQRKAYQAGGKETDSPAAQLNHAAVLAFERGCALGHGRSCVWLGHEVERGVHAERDVVRAASLLEKGCTLGEASGCRDAADMLETGRKARPEMLNPPPPPPVPKPHSCRATVLRAIALYERACEIGERDSCFIAARLLAAGEGIAPDRDKALALFAQMCDDGMALACTRAAALAAGREADYLRRACVLGGRTTAWLPASEPRSSSLVAQGHHRIHPGPPERRERSRRGRPRPPGRESLLQRSGDPWPSGRRAATRRGGPGHSRRAAHATPTPAKSATSLSTRASTVDRAAPRAMRIPISGYASSPRSS